MCIHRAEREREIGLVHGCRWLLTRSLSTVTTALVLSWAPLSSFNPCVLRTYQYRVKTTYITTFFFFLLLCFPEHCFCCLCLLFYPILYSFLFYSLLACVVILSHCVSFFLLSFCLNVERIVKLNLFQPILKKRQGKG